MLIINIAERSVFRWWDRCRIIRREGWSAERHDLRVHKLVVLQFNDSCSPAIPICERDRRLRQRDPAQTEGAAGMPEESQGSPGVQDRLVRAVRRPNGQVAWNSVPHVERTRVRLADTGRRLVSIAARHLRHIADDSRRRDIHRARHSDQRVAESSERRLK